MALNQFDLENIGRPNSGKKQISVTSMILPGLVSENSSPEIKKIYIFLIVLVKVYVF